jgi:hypothetical protein
VAYLSAVVWRKSAASQEELAMSNSLAELALTRACLIGSLYSLGNPNEVRSSSAREVL